MEIDEKKYGDVLVLSLSGELMGGQETKGFQDRIYRAIEEDDSKIVVDMNNLKWMNSSGLGIIMACLTTLRGGDGDLRLANISDRVKRPIEVTKLDRVIKLYSTVDEAVNSFTSGG